MYVLTAISVIEPIIIFLANLIEVAKIRRQLLHSKLPLLCSVSVKNEKLLLLCYFTSIKIRIENKQYSKRFTSLNNTMRKIAYVSQETISLDYSLQ